MEEHVMGGSRGERGVYIKSVEVCWFEGRLLA